MSLTPEQWRELDEADRLFGEFAAREAEPWREPSTGYMAAQVDLVNLLFEHRRALIDAARPKCQWCEGTGEFGWRPIEGSAIGVEPNPCPDRNGTGWAA